MAVYFDQNGNLVDTEISESSNVFMQDPTENFYQPRVDISPTQDFYQPQMDISPTQDFYQPQMDISPTQDFYQPRQFINAPQNFYPPDLTTLRGLDMNRFQGVGSLGRQDEDVEQVDSLTGEKKSGGITDLFKALIGFAVPGANFFLNQGQRGMDGIRSLNQRIRNTDFAKSSSLADYFDAKSYGGRDARDRAAQKTMREARAIQKQVDMRPSAIPTNQDRGRGQITSRTPSAPKRSFSSDYSAAQRARKF